jgi:hypothetical protein
MAQPTGFAAGIELGKPERQRSDALAKVNRRAKTRDDCARP